MVFELIIFGTLHFPSLHQDVIVRRDSQYFSNFSDCQKAIKSAIKDLDKEAQAMSIARKQTFLAEYHFRCKLLPGQRLTIRRAQGPA